LRNLLVKIVLGIDIEGMLLGFFKKIYFELLFTVSFYPLEVIE